ncbi:MAG: transposase [Anaerolineales bacterium]|nr:transposase [Anaerolineales bacterium]
MLRFLQCLGIEPRVYPPRHPEKNPFVERYHRNFQIRMPASAESLDLPNTVEVNKHYVQFYNFERPNQAITCGNQPPHVKFPEKPDLTPVPKPLTRIVG